MKKLDAYKYFTYLVIIIVLFVGFILVWGNGSIPRNTIDNSQIIIDSSVLSYFSLFDEDFLKDFVLLKQAHEHTSFWRAREVADALNTYQLMSSPIGIEDLEYAGYCNINTVVPQIQDLRCFDYNVISQHVAGLNPALECCQLWGQQWHRSFIILNKNPSAASYPYWNHVFLHNNLNPDLLPVSSALGAGISDFQRGGDVYQQLIISDAQSRLDFFKVYDLPTLVNYARELVNVSVNSEVMYVESKRIMSQATSGRDALLIQQCITFEELFLSGELSKMGDIAKSFLDSYEMGRIEKLLSDTERLLALHRK